MVNLTRLREMQAFYLRIRRCAEKTCFIRRFEDLVEAYRKNFDKATSSCFERIRNRPLVVESFNDAAYPFNGAEDCDVVLCVSSNIVLQFEKGKYFEAIESYSAQKPKLQLTVPQVYAPSLIKDRFIVQPLSIEERNDPAKLTENYAEIIAQLMRNM